MEPAHAMLREVVGKSHDPGVVFGGWTCQILIHVVMGKFKDLRAGKGGLKLVHMVLSHAIWENLSHPLGMQSPSVGLAILFRWTELKTAFDAVDYAMHMSTEWSHDGAVCQNWPRP